MLGTGPIARRACDLMPVLRLIAGPDGVDPLVRPATLGDPSDVSLEGLRVTTVESSSVLPMSRELRDARERAVGALVAAGARHASVSLRSWRRGVLPYLTTLQSGSPQTTIALLSAAGVPAPTWRSLARRGGPHTVQTRLTLAAELLPQLQGKALTRQLEAGRTLAAELIEAIGEGVLLHPAQPAVAPHHGRTLGRAWLLTPAAMFNLAGAPVTEVPLGLGSAGLPLGVQVAAGIGRDDVAIAVAIELERVFGGWQPP
jgi:fatty acid amide hydrolase 2